MFFLFVFGQQTGKRYCKISGVGGGGGDDGGFVLWSVKVRYVSSWMCGWKESKVVRVITYLTLALPLFSLLFPSLSSTVGLLPPNLHRPGVIS